MPFSISLSNAHDKELKRAIEVTQKEFEGNKKMTPGRIMKALAKVGLEKWAALSSDEKLAILVNID